MKPDQTDHTRVFIALLLASVILFVWQAKVEWPRRQALAKYEELKAEKARQAEAMAERESPVKQAVPEENQSLTWAQRIALSPRVAIDSGMLHGSIALKGVRFDDLTLKHYKETLAPDSPNVTLLSPNGGPDAYFVQAGWVSQGGAVKVPDQNSVWQADKQLLTAGGTVTLRWDNGQGVIFIEAISLDQYYMFTIDQRVENHSGHAIAVMPYAYINRAFTESEQQSAIMHEGPLGVIDGTLDEVPYKTLRDKGNKIYDHASGWFGITDKYWLSALIPSGQNKITFEHYTAGGSDRYQTDYLGEAKAIAAGADGSNRLRLFAGAKEIDILNRYAQGDQARHEPPIPLFDRAIDFGMFYLISKPMLLTLTFFYGLVGNFGIAILLLTVVLRALMYPLANKSYHATARMRELQPEITKLRERYFDDQITLQKETMALYKRQKINPAAGCLPVLIQMPIFFALYKVLYVSIEMRQAPFFGWIKDLSAPDPSNLFTGFGLIPWHPFHWMHLGLLPILYGITMIIQMRQQPKPADPTQARMMTYMPYFFLFIFANLPAGLVLYYTLSNLISIIQQRVITKHHAFSKARRMKRQMSDVR